MTNFRNPIAVGILIVSLCTGASAQEGLSTLGAIGGARAYSGNEIELGQNRFSLPDVTCPDPKTENGRRAKALANTFLRMRGTMRCESANGSGDCFHRSSSGIRRLSTVMLTTGLCWAGET